MTTQPERRPRVLAQGDEFMSLELQIIRLQEFIRLGPTGDFDLKASKAALALLGAACLKRGIHQALLDLRALQPGHKPVFSPQDLVSLVNTFHEVGFTSRHRLAVLYIVDPHERARMFASVARLRGWKVKAFGQFEEAVGWLSDAPAAQPGLQPAAIAGKTLIPVRKIKNPERTPPVTAAFQPVIKKKTGPEPQATPATTSPARGSDHHVPKLIGGGKIRARAFSPETVRPDANEAS